MHNDFIVESNKLQQKEKKPENNANFEIRNSTNKSYAIYFHMALNVLLLGTPPIFHLTLALVSTCIYLMNKNVFRCDFPFWFASIEISDKTDFQFNISNFPQQIAPNPFDMKHFFLFMYMKYWDFCVIMAASTLVSIDLKFEPYCHH